MTTARSSSAPIQLDAFLRRLDDSIERFGGTRGTVAAGTAKSSCRLLCPDDQRHRYAGWGTEYVRTTCKVLPPEGPTLALGVPFGSPAALDIATHDRSSQKVLEASREDLAQLDEVSRWGS